MRACPWFTCVRQRHLRCIRLAGSRLKERPNGRETHWRAKGYSVAAMRELARRPCPGRCSISRDGGAEDERTLRRNESAFDRLQLMPTPLNGSAVPGPVAQLFGHKLSMPVMIGPTGLAGLFWPGGEIAAAKAAGEAGTAYCLSHGSVCTLEELAGTRRVAPMDAGVHLSRPRPSPRNSAPLGGGVLRRARPDARQPAAGQAGARHPERLQHPAAVQAPATLSPWRRACPGSPACARNCRASPSGTTCAPGEANDIATLAGRMASLLDPAMSWRDVEWLRSIWRGPLVLKGVLHPAEAAEAVQQGVDGVIVSNHGGRQLDGAVSSSRPCRASSRPCDGPHSRC